MVFTVGFVIAVDDTLHFISSYKWHLRAGLPTARAVDEAIFQAGRGIVITSIALLGGFLVLAFADFWEIRVFGLLISVLLACALATDLLLLPTLLRYVSPVHRRGDTSRGQTLQNGGHVS